MKSLVTLWMAFMSVFLLAGEAKAAQKLPVAQTVSCVVVLRNQHVPNAKGGFPTFTVPVNHVEPINLPGYYGTLTYTVPGSDYQIGVVGYSQGPKDDTPDYVQLTIIDKQHGVWIEGGPVILPLLADHAKSFKHDKQPTATAQYHLGTYPPKIGVEIPVEVGATCWMNK